ncbi:MAG: hypothetical protein WA996_15530 [Candidatus Promineifilaceae bacterium]
MISLFLPAANPTYELLWAGHSATNSAINVFGEIVKCRWVLKGKYHLSMVFLLVPQRTQPLQHRREDNLPEMLPLTGIMPITTIQSFSRAHTKAPAVFTIELADWHLVIISQDC